MNGEVSRWLIWSLCVLVTVAGVRGQIVSTGNNCEENEALVSIRSNQARPDSKIIFIARPGTAERDLVYSRQRLSVLRRLISRGTIADRLVFAVGPRSHGKPSVEMYVNGVLDVVMETPSKRALRVGNCGN